MKTYCNSSKFYRPQGGSQNTLRLIKTLPYFDFTASIGRRRRPKHSEPVRGRKYRFGMGQEQSSLIDDSTPPQTLKERSVESVATYIKQGRAKKIVVMVSLFSHE